MMLSTQEWTLTLNIVSVASSITIVITLIVLIWQTRILQSQTQSIIDASRAQNHAVIREEMLKINEMFLQHPEIRKYFYEGVPIDTSNDSYACAEAAAEMLLDTTEHMLGQATLFPRLHRLSDDEKKFWQIWDTYTIDMFVSSPILLAYLQKKRTWYSSHLIERMEKAQRILSRRNADSN